MKNKTDQYYINKILEGDIKAFEVIIERYQDWVFTIIKRIINSREEAEEIAQDVFLKAFRSLDKYKGTSKFSSWLYRIAYNTAISSTRRKKLTASAIDDNIIENYTENDISDDINTLSNDEQKGFLEKALAELSSEEQIIIRLFYMNENSVEEIAQVCNLSVSNVKVKLHRTRKKLHMLIQNQIERKNKISENVL